MYSELKELFRYYWSKKSRNNHTYAPFKNLQNKAVEIVNNDPDMNWMDDLKTAIILHHILYVEYAAENYNAEQLWRAIRNNKMFTTKSDGHDLISIVYVDDVVLGHDDSYSLVDDHVNLNTLGVYVDVRNDEDARDLEESYPAIERFLEQQRNLFGRTVQVTLETEAMPCVLVQSSRVGEWYSYDYDSDYHEGTLPEVMTVLIDYSART